MRYIVLFALLAQQTMILDLPRGPAAAQFRRATGYPDGRAGYVVDHVIPICAGGPDIVSNMQWQEARESYRKDTFERQLCAAMSKQHLKMVHE